MTELWNLHQEANKETLAVSCMFPGIWICFLNDPRCIGNELHDSTEETIVLHYCHAGRVQIENPYMRMMLASGDILSLPDIGEEEVCLLSERYSGFSLIIAPKEARQTVHSFSADWLGMDLDFEKL